ncbi:hypothetical protein PspLS_04053 [Pyricularia sp. CBS 133598]|nr:hypothetical protein PspLS_04053 [Pyricularia sp. CBS 133598]
MLVTAASVTAMAVPNPDASQGPEVLDANTLEARAPAFPNPFKRCDKKKFNACTEKCHENRNGLGGNVDIVCISACVSANPKCKWTGKRDVDHAGPAETEEVGVESDIVEKRNPGFTNPFKRCDKKKFNTCTAKCHENRNGLGGNVNIVCISACVSANPKCKYRGKRSSEDGDGGVEEDTASGEMTGEDD